MPESVDAINILLVEDNPGDALLAQEALQDSKLLIKTHHVEDGVEALTFLRKEGVYTDVPTPDLIILDLNLPRKNGREVLAEIKSDDALKSLPVVVLTSSEAEKDILQSYALQANCYITKPIDLYQFMTIVQTIQDFWFTIVKLPPKVS